MTVDGLDHWTIAARDLDRSIEFYERIVGLRKGPRPDIPNFPYGAWLYCGSRPILHLIPAGQAQVRGSGAIDHIALSGTGLSGFLDLLVESGMHYREVLPSREVPRHQVFITDPDGIRVEVNFSSADGQGRTEAIFHQESKT